MTRITEWVLGIIGATAAFMGLFILLGGEGQSIGLGGDLTWQVGDVPAGWGYGMLIGGGVLLAGAFATLLWERSHPHDHTVQGERAGLITHIVVFLLVNGFLWLQDIAAGGGLEYAYWTTIPWGMGLLAHIGTYISAGRHAVTPHPTA